MTTLFYYITKNKLIINNFSFLFFFKHDTNILVHQKNIKLADFGLSKKIDESSSKLRMFGAIPYMDPIKFKNQQYKLNKKSDVYSIGVLFWEISSGSSPFYGDDRDLALVSSIFNGRREKCIDGTPPKYKSLYEGN
jgi:serine/threonine protein kinase